MIQENWSDRNHKKRSDQKKTNKHHSQAENGRANAPKMQVQTSNQTTSLDNWAKRQIKITPRSSEAYSYNVCHNQVTSEKYFF